MKVRIELKETTYSLDFDKVTNCFTKGDFYCVYQEHLNRLQKFPIGNIFRVLEIFDNDGERRELVS